MTTALTSRTAVEPRLEGPRLLLRPLQESDLTDRYLGWVNNPQVTKYLEIGKRPVSREDALAYLRSFGAEGWWLAILERDGNRPIGTVTLRVTDRQRRSAETGLMIGETDCWGRGYAFEAWSLLLRWAFETLGLEEIGAGAVDGHAASVTVLRRLGFQAAGRLRKQGDGFDWDTTWYQLTRREWNA